MEAKSIINNLIILIIMKTRILAIILIAVLILSAAATANIMLPQKFLQKTPTGFKLVLPARNLNIQQASQQIPQTPAILSSTPLDEWSTEKILEKEDEFKEQAEQKHLELSNKAKASIFRWYFSRNIRNRINIPLGASTAYPVELSPENRANPAFASVDMAKYQRFQSENQAIFREMIWQNPSARSESIIYSRQKMQDLAHYIALLETGQPFPFSAPAEGREVNLSGHISKVYTEEEAWRMYIPHIAMALYTEVNHIVPWSITEYSEYQRSLLLDGRKFINYDSENGGYRFYLNTENGGGMIGVTDWNPFASYQFLEENSMIKPTQAETIYELTQWMRVNIVHEALADQYSNREMYGYSGYYPVDKILYPPAGARHWTYGCSGTASLYSALLRTINLPVSINLTLGWHKSPVFITANLALGHGDDPYSMYNRRAPQEVPVERIFMTKQEFYDMNHAELMPYREVFPNEAQMAGWLHSRQNVDNAYGFMSYGLLKKRGSDVRYNRSYASTLQQWWMTDHYKPLYDNNTMNEIMQKMDNEILRIGAGNYTEGYYTIAHGITPVP